jgi:hypothetical protein
MDKEESIATIQYLTLEIVRIRLCTNIHKIEMSENNLCTSILKRFCLFFLKQIYVYSNKQTVILRKLLLS